MTIRLETSQALTDLMAKNEDKESYQNKWEFPATPKVFITALMSVPLAIALFILSFQRWKFKWVIRHVGHWYK